MPRVWAIRSYHVGVAGCSVERDPTQSPPATLQSKARADPSPDHPAEASRFPPASKGIAADVSRDLDRPNRAGDREDRAKPGTASARICLEIVRPPRCRGGFGRSASGFSSGRYEAEFSTKHETLRSSLYVSPADSSRARIIAARSAVNRSWAARNKASVSGTPSWTAATRFGSRSFAYMFLKTCLNLRSSSIRPARFLSHSAGRTPAMDSCIRSISSRCHEAGSIAFSNVRAMRVA